MHYEDIVCLKGSTHCRGCPHITSAIRHCDHDDHLVEEEGKMSSLNGVGKVGVVHHNQWRFTTKLKGHSLRTFQ